MGFYDNYIDPSEVSGYSQRQAQLREQEEREREEFLEMREAALSQQNQADRNLLDYKAKCNSSLLKTAFKGIYITAMEKAVSLSTPAVAMAEALVDKYVDDKGAYNLLLQMEDKTYLLDRIGQIVTEESEEQVEKADDEDVAMEREPEQETKEEVLDKLEKEEDTEKAVDLLAARISAAEEEFIKKNAEDKKKIEELVNDINDRINAVKDDPTMTDEEKEGVEEAYNMEAAKEADKVYHMRRHTVYEQLVHTLCNQAMTKEDIKKQYMGEDGKLDMIRVTESANCMYGFMEFLNTMNLEKVDEAYIENMLKELEA